jgi:hypothetical protein
LRILLTLWERRYQDKNLLADAGDMLLDIEMRIGELAEKEEGAKPIITRRQPNGSVLATKQDKPPKHERLGLHRKGEQMDEFPVGQPSPLVNHPWVLYPLVNHPSDTFANEKQFVGCLCRVLRGKT